LSKAKHNKKLFEAKPAEFNCALDLTARDLLFFNVKQNIIHKRAIESRQNKPIQKLSKTFQYKLRLRSAGKAEKIAIVD
jgi:hypothetical protein